MVGYAYTYTKYHQLIFMATFKQTLSHERLLDQPPVSIKPGTELLHTRWTTETTHRIWSCGHQSRKHETIII